MRFCGGDSEDAMAAWRRGRASLSVGAYGCMSTSLGVKRTLYVMAGMAVEPKWAWVPRFKVTCP